MISTRIRKLLRFAWFLPGFLLWASFPPMAERTDCLFALAPLLWLGRNREPRLCFRRWFANGFLFWFATLAWMPAIVKNGGPWPLVVLGWGALAAYCALYFGAFGFLSARYWRWATVHGSYGLRLLGIFLVEPLLWSGLELVRSRFLGGFAWNQLGVAPVNCGFGAPAALGGVYLVSALVILVNGTVATIAERFIETYFSNRRRIVEVEVGGQTVRIAENPRPSYRVPKWARSCETLVPFLVIFATYRLADSAVVAPPPSDWPVRRVGVAMIQRNFPCCFQAQAENPAEVYSNLLAHVETLRPELVVLPESAMAEFGELDGANALRFAEGVCRRSGLVLAGGGRTADGKMYNSAALYNGRHMQIYDKVHLVPFGEFIPCDKLIPALQSLAPVGSCTPGALELLYLHDIPLGVAICFEDTDSAQIRRLAAMGAKMLVFITNDSWFSHSDEAVQHAWQARARAIETGLPVVRVGNSGVTGTIASDGSASWLVGPDARPLVDAGGTMFDRVAPRPLDSVGTPYVAFGDIPLAVAFALLILAMVLVKYRNIYEKRRTLSL